MNYVLRILNKALANERGWLRMEFLGAADVKYKEGARMARERIPQLEEAIKLLTSPPTGGNTNADVSAKGKENNNVAKPKDISHRQQLNLFQL